ncbi:conserved hypothetical protein [Hyella patelloides LEGE 07179]|uniref:Transposase n=1 Tax=Hyella patelloides LEGE 07179 TaxID=945734 RepID=A0A563VTP4_9CYAN|nr:hypothetical protein [Hyella patelloides]VEP14852.1 conserved hypothetical protein [Hyella patelloides LEGE 07179]
MEKSGNQGKIRHLVKKFSKMPDINLKLFREQVYHCLGNAKDAVFELTDAAILTRSPESLAELSLSPVFRRKWHSTYEALEDCNPSREKMMAIMSQQIVALNQRPLLVGDHSAWFRPDALTLSRKNL